MHKGSCLCGHINYRIEGELSNFGYCHCTSCRKASGSSHGANAGLHRSKFELMDPHGWLREYESSPGKLRAFCSNCGSPVYAYLNSTPDIIRIRLGSLDTPFTKHAKAHTFVSDKASWEVIDGDLPQFDEWAPRDILIQTGSRQP
ncbi:MAG: GFA family protein [Gammaproteobacteria bacterium]|nr:GFA family protein [Gammaproteobacteria bacterium]